MFHAGSTLWFEWFVFRLSFDPERFAPGFSFLESAVFGGGRGELVVGRGFLRPSGAG